LIFHNRKEWKIELRRCQR